MRVHCTALLAIVFTSAFVAAGERHFPYEAEVVPAQAAIYSGPGRQYYPTGKLSRGARVKVLRHDMGGWYAIAPPAGSFSWIRAEYVDRQGNRGVITSNNVAVRVGSTLSDLAEVQSKTLSAGDEVQIVGEQSFPSETGPKHMYRISPPRDELRWIMGQDVSPAGSSAAVQQYQPMTQSPPDSHENWDELGEGVAGAPRPAVPSASEGLYGDGDPFGSSRDDSNGFSAAPSPTSAASPFSSDEPPSTIVERPLVRVTEGEAIHRTSPPTDDVDYAQLDELNDRFRVLVDQDTKSWTLAELDELEGAYRQIQNESSHPTLLSRVDLKLREIEHCRNFKREYDDFFKLTSETTQRETQLLQMQRHRLPPNENGGYAAERIPYPTPAGELPNELAPTLETDPFSSPTTSPSISMPPDPGSQSGVPYSQQPPTYPSMTDELQFEPPIPVGTQPGQPSTMAAPYSPTGPTTSMPPVSGDRALVPYPQMQQYPPSATGQPQFEPPVLMGRQPAPPVHPSAPPVSQPKRFDGAGIVQRAATTYPGAPGYVLLAPNGRILAYLEGQPGVNLDQYLGRPMGLIGPRGYRDDLQADFISVQQLVPVRLKTGP